MAPIVVNRETRASSKWAELSFVRAAEMTEAADDVPAVRFDLMKPLPQNRLGTIDTALRSHLDLDQPRQVNGCCKQATALLRGRNHHPVVACLCLLASATAIRM